MSTIELTGDDRINNRDVARVAYHDNANINDWGIDHDGNAVLSHDNGSTLVLNLEENREWTETDDEDVETITVDGWTATIYDAEGYAETTDGAPIHNPAGLDTLTDCIAEWAA